MASLASAARFLLLTVLGFAGNPSTSTADAESASPVSVSGWRSDLDWAALTSSSAHPHLSSTLPTRTSLTNVDLSFLSLVRQTML
jgi:hypothetical protein